MKKAITRFRGAGDERAMVFVETRVLVRRHDGGLAIEGDLGRELRTA